MRSGVPAPDGKATGPLQHLADILGHSSIDTTRIYIITTIREHQRQLDSMSLVLQE